MVRLRFSADPTNRLMAVFFGLMKKSKALLLTNTVGAPYTDSTPLNKTTGAGTGERPQGRDHH